MKKYFLLELHDVTPYVDREFAAMLEWARRFGAAEPLILCTPRWQQSRQTAVALQELNFKGYLGLRGIFVFPRTFLPLPVLSFDHGSRAWVNRLNRHIERHRLARLLHHQLPFRLALHPRDMNRPPVLRLLTEIHHHLTSAAYQPTSLQKLLKLTP